MIRWALLLTLFIAALASVLFEAHGRLAMAEASLAMAHARIRELENEREIMSEMVRPGATCGVQSPVNGGAGDEDGEVIGRTFGKQATLRSPIQSLAPAPEHEARLLACYVCVLALLLLYSIVFESVQHSENTQIFQHPDERSTKHDKYLVAVARGFLSLEEIDAIHAVGQSTQACVRCFLRSCYIYLIYKLD